MSSASFTETSNRSFRFIHRGLDQRTSHRLRNPQTVHLRYSNDLKSWIRMSSHLNIPARAPTKTRFNDMLPTVTISAQVYVPSHANGAFLSVIGGIFFDISALSSIKLCHCSGTSHS